MTWASLCLFALAATSAPSPAEFDFEQRAASLDVVLKNLSERSGVALKAAPAIAHEIVLIAAQKTNVEELKSQLAKTLDATWTKASDAEYLNRTPAQTKAIYDRHLAYRRKLVDEAMSELKKPVERAFDGGSLAAGLLSLPERETLSNDLAALRRANDEEHRLFGNGPAARLIRRLLLACRPQDLASVGPYERAVFRAQPTARQFGFDRRKLEDALKEYGKEQTAWVGAARAVNFPARLQGGMVSDPRLQLDYPTQTPEEFKLIVRRGDMANLFLANLEWESEARMSQIVAQLSVDDPMRKFLNASITPAPPNSEDPLVPLSPNTALFLERMQALNGGPAVAPLKPETLQLLLNPDRFDPLGFGASDGFLAARARLNKNIVASLSDLAASATWFMSRENPLRVDAFLRAQTESGTLRIEEEGDWRRYFPADRYEAALQFTPRDAIAFLTQSIHRLGRLDVRGYAAYAYRSKRIARVGLGDIYMMLIDRSASSGIDRTDWNALRLYGSFDRPTQTRLEAGAQFSYASLTTEQRRIVDRIVYADEIRSEQVIDAHSTRLLGTEVEPTEDFANGLPAGAFVYARVQSMPVIVAYGKDAGGKIKPLRTLNEWTLATFDVDGKGNPELLNRYGVPGLAGYAMGQNKMIALRVALREGLWKESVIVVLDPPENPSPVPWDKLPPKVADAIRAAIEQKKAGPTATPPVRPPAVFWAHASK